MVFRVLGRLYQTDGSLQMSSSKKVKNICYARSTAERHLIRKYHSITTTHQSDPAPRAFTRTRTGPAFLLLGRTINQVTGVIHHHQISPHHHPQVLLIPLESPSSTAAPPIMWRRWLRITRGSGGATIC